jgi:hypothetical protein
MTLDDDLQDFKARVVYFVHKRRSPGSRASLDDARKAASIRGFADGLGELEEHSSSARPVMILGACLAIIRRVGRIFTAA